MGLIHYNAVFDVIDELFKGPCAIEAGGFIVPGDSGAVRLSPAEARDALYSRRRARGREELGDAIWRQAIASARGEAGQDGYRRVLAIWLALPRLRRAAYHLLRQLPVGRDDIEAEMLLAFTEELEHADPHRPGVGDELGRVTVLRAWQFAGRAVRESPAGDIAGIAAARDAREPTERDMPIGGPWELEIAPPDRAEGLAAPLRFTVSERRIEGLRLGALAEQLGLRDIVYRARRPGEGRRIGTLSLHPAGAAR